MDDLQEDDEFALAEVVSQSTQELGFDSQSGSQSTSLKTSFFTNYYWLHNYFEKREKLDNSIAYFCKGCDSSFTSRSNKRLIGHYNKCPQLQKEKENTIRGVNMQHMHDGENQTNKWLKVMIENNLSFKTIESKSFREFIRSVPPSWQPPTRQELSNVYIPKFSRTLQSRFLTRVTLRGSSPHLSIEFDGWKDRNNRSFLGVVATEMNGRKHLLDLRDLSLKCHTSAVFVEELTDILKSVPTHAINSIMSDSAANCKKARQDLTQREPYKHVIQHRCLAHLLNSIGSKLTSQDESISKLLNDASVIVNAISASSYWTAYVKQLKMKKINRSCPVRWYSTVNMLVHLVDLKAVILDKVLSTLTDEKKDIVSNFDWIYLDEVLEVLKMINRCIGSLERKDISLGTAISEILAFARDLFNLTPSNTVSSAKKAFLTYFNVTKLGRAEFGLYIAAYILDPRFKLAYVTEEGVGLALEAITRIAVKSGIKLETVESCLADDFETYNHNVSKSAAEGNIVGPARWWNTRMIGVMLGRVAIRLANLKASSANIERTFSTVKYIQSGGRLNFDTSTLVDIARLKISFQQEEEEEVCWIDDDEPSSQALTDQSCNSSSELDLSDTELDVSNLTPGDEQTWLEDEEPQTKRNYQAFFQYFDFRHEPIQPTLQTLNVSDEITEDQIDRCVKVVRVKRGSKRTRILEESTSRTEQNGVIEGPLSNSENDDATYLDQYADFQL